MDKTSGKVTKDPKRVEPGRKGREKYVNDLKESILNDAKKGSEDTINASNETTSHTINASNEIVDRTTSTTTRLSDTYVYGVGMLAVLAISVCVFLAYNTSQVKNKKQANEKQDQPPKRHML